MEVLDLVVDLFPSIISDMLDSVLHLFWKTSHDQEMQTRILRVLAKATMSPSSDRTHKESLKRFKEDVRKICARDGKEAHKNSHTSNSTSHPQDFEWLVKLF